MDGLLYQHRMIWKEHMLRFFSLFWDGLGVKLSELLLFLYGLGLGLMISKYGKTANR